MSRDPIRLEPFLTRDFVDRNAKMNGLSERYDPYINSLDLVCCWIIVGGLVGWIWMLW